MSRLADTLQARETATASDRHPPATAPAGAAALIGLQQTAGNRAVAAMFARRWPAHDRSPAGVPRAAANDPSPHAPRALAAELRRAAAARRGPRVALQRKEEDGWIGSMFDSLEASIGAAGKAAGEALESAGSKIGTAFDLAKYPTCTMPAPKPELNLWLDNKGLETIRNGEGEVLSKSTLPSGGDRGATRLLKQGLRAWGCDALGRDVLPKYGTGGPFGPETAAAVEALQRLSGLSVDGVVGRQTLNALDRYLDVEVLPAPPSPGSVGGSKAKGKSTWARGRNPIGRIYFPTDGDVLDRDDERILEAMADAARGVEEITLRVVGYTDKRESGGYNADLSARRAAVVEEYLYDLLTDRGVNFSTTATALGEIERPQPGETDEALKPFRRADIYVDAEVLPEVVEEEEEEECLLCVPEDPPPKEKGNCNEPTTEWQARIRDFGGTVVYTTGLVDIRMAKPDSKGNRWEKTYLFKAGLGFSLDIGVSGSAGSRYKHFSTTVPLTIKQFAGPAAYASAGFVAGEGVSCDHVVMLGPEDLGANRVELEWCGKSTGLGIGGGTVTGTLGYYRSAAACHKVREGSSG